jgi:hypothetical protein
MGRLGVAAKRVSQNMKDGAAKSSQNRQERGGQTQSRVKNSIRRTEQSASDMCFHQKHTGNAIPVSLYSNMITVFIN